MEIVYIEIALVLFIILFQVSFFIRTWRQVLNYRAIIPSITEIGILDLYIPLSHLEKQKPSEIIYDFKKYQFPSDNVLIDRDGSIYFLEVKLDDDNLIVENKLPTGKVNIIHHEEQSNTIFLEIINSINNYLIRNQAAASDFGLIKDIVERNVNAVEEDINLSISTPLYLGLMGTMLGIIIGLFNMPDLAIVIDSQAKDLALNEGISGLIGGVKIAMVASFVGLLLTIINSAIRYKGSRSHVEACKHRFYTFIQVELLPVINQGLGSTFESLQRNLLKFNNEFTINIVKMSGVFDSNTKTVIAQKELLDAIDKTKISEMSRYNVSVLHQLNTSVKEFEKFNQYIQNVNKFISNSQLIVSRTGQLLDRTEDFGTIANSLNSKLDQSQQLLEFLSAHFENLEAHKTYTAETVADVGHVVSQSFKDLREHISNSSEAFKQFTVDETAILKKALSESKTNLGNLEFLPKLSSDLGLIKDSSASQLERLKTELSDNTSELKSVNRNLEKLIRKEGWIKRFGRFLNLK